MFPREIYKEDKLDQLHFLLNFRLFYWSTYEARHEKTSIRGLRPG